MNRITRTLYILPVAGLIALSCAGSPTEPDPFDARQLSADLREEADEVVAGNNTFALDLYGNLRAEEGNLFLSPFSISTAFAMVYGGARGETEQQIAQVFHFGLGQDRLHTLYQALLASLDTGAGFDGYRLDVANRLWGQKGFSFLPSYLDLTRNQYGAELEVLDFQADAEACRTTINNWVADHTGQLIKDLMPAGSITSLTRLVLTNAIYFKGKWATEFDPDLTRPIPFYVTPEQTVEVDMMVMKEFTYSTYATEDVALAELPYRGKDISMILLVPTRLDGLPAVEAVLTPENLAAWMGAMEPRKQDLYLPRFEVASEFGLNDVLAAMGMPDAFDPQTADFSGMDGERDLSIQAAVHKAFVKVNEEGTEAAAATGVGMGTTSVPPSVRADRPFLFLIHDNVTGSILFLGRVADPTAG